MILLVEYVAIEPRSLWTPLQYGTVSSLEKGDCSDPLNVLP